MNKPVKIDTSVTFTAQTSLFDVGYSFPVETGKYFIGTIVAEFINSAPLLIGVRVNGVGTMIANNNIGSASATSNLSVSCVFAMTSALDVCAKYSSTTSNRVNIRGLKITL